MKTIEKNKRRIGFVFFAGLLVALLGCSKTTIEQTSNQTAPTPAPEQPGSNPSQPLSGPPPRLAPAAAPAAGQPGLAPAAVEVQTVNDFYEPLAPHGEWIVVGSHGRCWRPRHVPVEWRPYCNGSWEYTDAGWYWVSDESWAWATYHYGRWDSSPEFGWYWVPQTQWAPAWVSWHEGGGYIGWAPLMPSVSISVNGFVGFDAAIISPRAFVFVEQREFLSPIRPTTVVVNNTTIINKTTTITNTKIVNNTVINNGPSTTVVENASGKKIHSVAAREVRQKEENTAAAKQPKVAELKQRKVEPKARALKEAAPAPGGAKVEPHATKGEEKPPAEKREQKRLEAEQKKQGTEQKKEEEKKTREELQHEKELKKHAQTGEPRVQKQPPAPTTVTAPAPGDPKVESGATKGEEKTPAEKREQKRLEAEQKKKEQKKRGETEEPAPLPQQ